MLKKRNRGWEINRKHDKDDKLFFLKFIDYLNFGVENKTYFKQYLYFFIVLVFA